MLFRRVRTVAAFALAASMSGCGSFNFERCGPGTIGVDGRGDVVVGARAQLSSPNSQILSKAKRTLESLHGELDGDSPEFALASGDRLYVFSTKSDENELYRVDLRSGRGKALGSASSRYGNESSYEVAAGGRYAYVADCGCATSSTSIGRVDLATHDLKPVPFIRGPRTQLAQPVSVAAEDSSRLCVVDGGADLLLCYGPDRGGNVAPAVRVDLRALLGYRQVDSVAFDASHDVVVAGNSQRDGLAGFSIAVITFANGAPRVVRKIEGPHTRLTDPPTLAVDLHGDILDAVGYGGRPLAFGPNERGDAAPIEAPEFAAVEGAYRIAIDRNDGDVAIGAPTGVFLFRGAATRDLERWPKAVRLPIFGATIAFGRNRTLLAVRSDGRVKSYDLHEPDARLKAAVMEDVAVDAPSAIIVNARHRVYLVGERQGIVSEFDDVSPGTVASHWLFRPPHGCCDDIAADASGSFYLLADDAVVVVDAAGAETRIEGRSTTLRHPSGLAVTRDGSLLVANGASGSVLRFAPGARGDVAPEATLKGAATKLSEPDGVAVDAHDHMYVYDGPSGDGSRKAFVRRFSAEASGNISPDRSFEAESNCESTL